MGIEVRALCHTSSSSINSNVGPSSLPPSNYTVASGAGPYHNPVVPTLLEISLQISIFIFIFQSNLSILIIVASFGLKWTLTITPRRKSGPTGMTQV